MEKRRNACVLCVNNDDPLRNGGERGGEERERERESIAALDYAAMTAAESKTGFGMVRERERRRREGLMSNLSRFSSFFFSFVSFSL